MTGAAHVVSESDRINATAGDPCDWLNDNATLICKTVPMDRGPAPAEPTVAPGPNTQENNGKAAPAPTYEDLLKTVHDSELFEYYFTSQLVSYNIAHGARTPIGAPAILTDAAASRSAASVLVTKVNRPFSHLIPPNSFPAH